MVGVIECWLGSVVAVRLSEARGFRVYLEARLLVLSNGRDMEGENKRSQDGLPGF